MDPVDWEVRSAPLPGDAEVVVVGAGLAGLSCALLLERSGVNVHVVEASDGVGGLVRTDRIDGFLLDRGFQVLLTAYEELQSQVDLPRLDLKAFKPGSLVWNGQSLEKMSDPFRSPGEALGSLRARVGTLGDKMKVARLRRDVVSRPAASCFSGSDSSTADHLDHLGFSPGFVSTFFRPFLGGVFLERDLETSARLFRYYFRCFSIGDAAVPSKGMQRLPELLAQPLEDRITLNSPATGVSPDGVQLASGDTLPAEHVVVAVDGSSAGSLLATPPPEYKSAVTAYFASSVPPVKEPLLVLDGAGDGPANHVAVMTNVSADYGPPGEHLISVSGVGEAVSDGGSFEGDAKSQLRAWFGNSVEEWRHLRTYRIPRALPRHLAGSVPVAASAATPNGIVVAGDYTEFGAIQGALVSGRRAAEAVLDRR